MATGEDAATAAERTPSKSLVDGADNLCGASKGTGWQAWETVKSNPPGRGNFGVELIDDAEFNLQRICASSSLSGKEGPLTRLSMLVPEIVACQTLSI